MSGNQSPEQALYRRQKYVNAFNATMIEIWKEQIVKLGVIDTGALFRSLSADNVKHDGEYMMVEFAQKFLAYGLFVNYGTGREVYRGNPGDIGRPKVRVARDWFSRKYYASFMNLREFYADNTGQQAVEIISNAFTRNIAMRFAI